MKIEIIAVGNEFASGEVVNTHSPELARLLTERGFEVAFLTTARDHESDIEDVLLKAHSRADVIIVSGGLRSAADHFIVTSSAKALGRRLVMNQEVRPPIKEPFARVGVETPRASEKQALFPQGAEVLPNPLGTAPGFILRDNAKLLIHLPGVPREFKPMLQASVVPFLEKERGEKIFYRSRTLKVFGYPEAALADLLGQIDSRPYSATLTNLPQFPENHVKITVSGMVAEEAERNLRELERILREKLSGHVVAADQETLEEVVGQLLRSHQATLAVAESCTGGLIAHRLTDIPGSSDYFERGVIVYSNRSKMEILGVPEELLAAHGAVSAEVAQKMAGGVRQISGATLGLGITGVAGPGGGSADKPLGTVFIALATPMGTAAKRYWFQGDRKQVKNLSAHTALDWVRRFFLN